MAEEEYSPHKLGLLLVKEGLITNEQKTRALEYQCRLPPGKYMALAEVLISFEYITPEQLKTVLGQDLNHQEDPICQILLQEKIITPEQLEQAMLVLNAFPKSHIGNILADLGLVSQAQIEQSISKYQLDQSGIEIKQNWSGRETKQTHSISPLAQPPSTQKNHFHLPLGRILMAKGLISENELLDALEYQKRLPPMLHKPLGEILIALGYIDQAHLEEALSEQKQAAPKSSIGEILVEQGVIAPWQLSRALSQQFEPDHAHKKLGVLLIEMGFSTRQAIEAALSSHYAVKNASPPQPTLSVAPTLPNSIKEKDSGHKPLGQILVESHLITQNQLDSALEEQKKMSSEHLPLGDLLILKELINEEELQKALSQQGHFKRKPIGQILIQYGVIEDWQLSHALCMQHEQAPKKDNLGTILVKLGYAAQAQIEEAIILHFKNKSDGQ